MRDAEVKGRIMTGNWRTSSFSFSNGNCVEVASGVAVRDTQDREGPVLKFSADAWRAFTARLVPGECTVCGGQNGNHASWCGHGR
jgi:Domain of unknown function (DUF397)